MLNTLAQSRAFWLILMLTILGEFLVPAFLSRRDPDYRPGMMAVSVLGRTGGPAARIYNAWLVWLGLFLLCAASVYYTIAAPVSWPLAVWQSVSIGLFALGAGVLAGLFPTGLERDLSDRRALIHGIASALGFFALLGFPLSGALLAWIEGRAAVAAFRFLAFVLALTCFMLFILSDKARFHHTVIVREGLWEQLCLAAMYLPFFADSVQFFKQTGI